MVDNKATVESENVLTSSINDLLRKFNSMIESENDVIQQCGGLRVRVYEAGQYVDTKTGEKKDYEEGIELRHSGIKIVVLPSDLALLVHHLKNNPDLRKIVNERLEVEKQLLSKVTL